MARTWTYLGCFIVGVYGHGSMVQPRPRNAVEKSIAPWNGTFSSSSNWDHREYAYGISRDVNLFGSYRVPPIFRCIFLNTTGYCMGKDTVYANGDETKCHFYFTTIQLLLVVAVATRYTFLTRICATIIKNDDEFWRYQYVNMLRNMRVHWLCFTVLPIQNISLW